MIRRLAPKPHAILAALLLAGVFAMPAIVVPAIAQEETTGRPVPRFVSLKSAEVNVRAGPGERYPVKWVFVKSGLPVEIIAEWDLWRKIRDWEGQEGWVHSALLSSKRRVIVTGETRTLYRRAEETSPPVVQLEPGIVADIEDCGGEWCRVEVRNYRGWLRRQDIWGVYPDEIVR